MVSCESQESIFRYMMLSAGIESFGWTLLSLPFSKFTRPSISLPLGKASHWPMYLCFGVSALEHILSSLLLPEVGANAFNFSKFDSGLWLRDYRT